MFNCHPFVGTPKQGLMNLQLFSKVPKTNRKVVTISTHKDDQLIEAGSLLDGFLDYKERWVAIYLYTLTRF